jgi:hypothetical protein
MINLINALQEGNMPKEEFKIGLQLNLKSSYCSFINTLLSKNKNICLLNFDINFLRYLSHINSNLKENRTNTQHILTDYSQQISDFHKRLAKDSIVVIVGIDLVDKKTEIIRIIKEHRCLVVFSYEKSFKNLVDKLELEKDLVRNCLECVLIENSAKSDLSSNKYYILCDSYNFLRSSIELVVFEFNIHMNYSQQKHNTSKVLIESLGVLSMEYSGFVSYKKEHKDLFEIAETSKDQPEPTSTFNLEQTEEDRLNKQKVIIPYLKEHNPNLIKVDNEDLRELYDEDPDEDLDI